MKSMLIRLARRVLAAGILLALAVPARAAEITKGPWLVRPSRTGVTIMIEADVDAEAVVRYGEGEALNRTAKVRPHARNQGRVGRGRSQPMKTLHLYAVEIDGLTPGTKYGYQVEIEGTKSLPARFATLPVAAEKVTFIAYGDTQARPEIHNALAPQFMAHAPDFILHMGDFTHAGIYGQWDACYFRPLAGIIDRVPLWPAFGNHDRVESYSLVFNFAPDTPLYYSFDYGKLLHVTALNSLAKGKQVKEMLVWCEKDLAASKAAWKVIFYHHPSYNVSAQREKWGRRDFVPLFHKHGVDLVLAGHSHLYERFFPLTSAEAPDRPVTYLVTGGGGGNPWEPVPHPYLASAKSAFHYLVITIEGEAIRIRAIDEKGNEIDQVAWSRRNGVPHAEYAKLAKPRAGFALDQTPRGKSVRLSPHIDLGGMGRSTTKMSPAASRSYSK